MKWVIKCKYRVKTNVNFSPGQISLGGAAESLISQLRGNKLGGESSQSSAVATFSQREAGWRGMTWMRGIGHDLSCPCCHCTSAVAARSPPYTQTRPPWRWGPPGWCRLQASGTCPTGRGRCSCWCTGRTERETVLVELELEMLFPSFSCWDLLVRKSVIHLQVGTRQRG